MNRHIAALAILATGMATAFGSGFSVSFEPDTEWKHTEMIGVFPITIVPQFAVRLESGTGEYVDTIFVTKKSGSGALNVKDAFRPEALPVWAHARGVMDAKGAYWPDAKTRLPDAVSGATPGGAWKKIFAIPEKAKGMKLRLRLEINKSFDWDASFGKESAKGTGVNGRPSLVYEASLDAASGTVLSDFSVLGYGSVSGADGSISKPDITAAKIPRLIKNLKVKGN